MSEQQHDNLKILNSVLDKMLASAEFRQQAMQSNLDVLLVASRLIEASHPQLSLASKHIIHQQILESINVIDSSATPDSALPDATKSRIFDRMMAHAPETDKTPELDSDAKERMFNRVLTAQQQLQIDALIESDEALELATSNPDPLIQTAVVLRTAPVPKLSQDSKSAIRERLLLGEQPRKARILRPNFGATFQRIVASIAIFLFISLIAIPRVAADSLPGDLFYPVKRTMETVSLHFAPSDTARMNLYLHHAGERIAELNALAEQSIYNTDILNDAFDSLESVTVIARENALMDDIVLQNDLSATFSSLSLVVLDYEDHDVSANIDSLLTRQEQLAITLLLTTSPENDIIRPDLPEPIEPPLIDSAPAQDDTLPESPMLIESDMPVIRYASLLAGGNVRVRSHADINSEILATIAPRSAVTQLAISADALWEQVRLENGIEGWIASFLLVDTPPPAQINPVIEQTSGTGSTNQADDSTNALQADDSVRINPNPNANANENATTRGNANSNGNRP